MTPNQISAIAEMEITEDSLTEMQLNRLVDAIQNLWAAQKGNSRIIFKT